MTKKRHRRHAPHPDVAAAIAPPDSTEDVSPDGTVEAMAAHPLGQLEIAEMLGVPLNTVHKWIQRGLLPPANYPSVNGARAWERQAILGWAGRTGRLGPDGALAEEYRRKFKNEPLTERKGGRLPEAVR